MLFDYVATGEDLLIISKGSNLLNMLGVKCSFSLCAEG